MLLFALSTAAYGARDLTPIGQATTFGICEYVDEPDMVDELINSGVEVTLRGYFKWGSDPADWSPFAAGVAKLHAAGVPVIGGFTASSFFLNEDGTTQDQFNDYVTRDARGQIAIIWNPNGAHYANSNPAVVDYLLAHARKQVEAGLDGFHIDEPQDIGAPSWNAGDEGYDDYAMSAFRAYLAAKYPDYSAADWKKKFDIDDIATFNYRDYLAAHGWADAPFISFLTNPLFFEWEPLVAWASPAHLFTADPEAMYSENDFHGHAARQYVGQLADGIRAMAQEYGRKLYVNVNGVSPYVDFQITGILAPFPLTWSLIDWFREDRLASRALLGRDAPMIFFVDWPASMEWYGSLSEQERIDYVRIYSAEAYAAGCFYAFHYHNYLQDFRTNGTYELVYHLVAWFRAHAAYYHGLVESPRWPEVKTSNYKVAHTLWVDADQKLALLHLINHNYDYAAPAMTPLADLQVVAPVGRVVSAQVISPDFDGVTPVSFQTTDDATTLTIPRLEFYDVVVMAFEEPPADDDDDNDDNNDDNDDNDDDDDNDSSPALRRENGGKSPVGCGCD